MLNENRFLGTFRGHNTRTTGSISSIEATLKGSTIIGII